MVNKLALAEFVSEKIIELEGLKSMSLTQAVLESRVTHAVIEKSPLK